MVPLTAADLEYLIMLVTTHGHENYVGTRLKLEAALKRQAAREFVNA